MTQATLADEIKVTDAPDIPGLRFRHWRDEADFPALYAVAVASIEADGREVWDSAEEFAARYRRLKHCDLTRDVLIAEVDGAMIAYSRAEWEDRDGQRTYSH